jgi:hypothetical protein
MVVNTSVGQVISVERLAVKKNARKWARLQLAIPVFVRTRDEKNSDLLEFATAINISAGGALIAVRRPLPKSTSISLEIPSAPVGPTDSVPGFSRLIRAKTVWVSHLNDYHLMGLKFARPLNTDKDADARRHVRKTGAAV